MEQPVLLDKGRTQGIVTVHKWPPELIEELLHGPKDYARFGWECELGGGLTIPSLVLIEQGIEPVDEFVSRPNLLLNEGITEMWNLIAGEGSPTSFAAATAQCGVGTSTTAAAAGQTDLQAGGVWKGMNGSYPTVTGQYCEWQSEFGASEANQSWQEASVRNDSTADKNIARLVQDMGTKASPAVWVLTYKITLS